VKVMAGFKRDRERRPGRRDPFREPKPVILVVTEGIVTEIEYIQGFKAACKNPRVDVQHPPKGGGVPKTLVQVAKKLKVENDKQAKREGDDNIRFDEVWVVFDTDEHPNIDQARRMADDNDIKAVQSNPSFELWLLLHFRDSPGQQHRDKIRELLKAYVKGYDKHVEYDDFEACELAAETRAEKLDKVAKSARTPHHNPTTEMYLLTRSIRGSA